MGATAVANVADVSSGEGTRSHDSMLQPRPLHRQPTEQPGKSRRSTPSRTLSKGQARTSGGARTTAVKATSPASTTSFATPA
jgi:hypothetical protein